MNKYPNILLNRIFNLDHYLHQHFFSFDIYPVVLYYLLYIIGNTNHYNL